MKTSGTWRGNGRGTGASYIIPLPNAGPIQQTFRSSLNYTRTETENRSDSVINSSALETGEVEVAWSPGVSFASAWNWINLSSVWSPGNLSLRNDDTTFSGVNPATDSNYRILRAEFGRSMDLPEGFAFNTKLRAQVADTSLISGNFAPGDEFSGYHLGSMGGDEGYSAGGQLCLPKINLGSLPEVKEPANDLQLFAFSNFGRYHSKSPTAAYPDQRLISFGPGATYQHTKFLSFKFAYGWQFEDERSNQPPSNWANASMKLDF